MKKQDVLNKYYDSVDKIVNKFLAKQGYVDENGKPYSYEYLDDSHNVIELDNMFLSLDDIIYDLNRHIKEGKIFEWYNYSLVWELKGYPAINYYSYLMGYRNKKRNFVQELIYRVKKWILYKWTSVKYRKEFNKIINK